MKTKIIERKEIEQAIECLKMGGVVAFPTDTVYGLGVIYDELEALERLKLSKGRPEEKPIPMMIGSKEQLETVAFTNEKVERLIEAFMPGGFTIILKNGFHFIQTSDIRYIFPRNSIKLEIFCFNGESYLIEDGIITKICNNGEQKTLFQNMKSK